MTNEPPAPPPPDTKDWTWVLDETCPECGYDGATIELADVPTATRAVAADLAAHLRADPEQARRRPSPDVWSATEYGCHVRDVFVLFDHRLARMLDEDDPHFDNWDQDATAIAERYDLADPELVAGELEATAEPIARRFATVSGDAWDRRGFRGDGAVFTVASFARYFLHDPWHHLHDVRRDDIGYRR